MLFRSSEFLEDMAVYSFGKDIESILTEHFIKLQRIPIINPDLLHHIQQALQNNNVTIHIGWGNLYDINSAKKSAQVLLAKSGYNAFNSLQRLQCIQFKLLGTHEKFLICDDKWALITSYNFLSASDFMGVNGEREIGLLTYDKNIIKELKDHYEKSPEHPFP